MLVLITSLTSETRVSLDADRVRAIAARCGKPMTVWTYTLPIRVRAAQAARLRTVRAQRPAQRRVSR